MLGDEESLNRIGVDDLHAWRSEHYRAGSLCLVAAGKVDHGQLVALGDQWFGDLDAGTSPAPEPAQFTGGTRVGRTQGDQAHLALGFSGPALLDDQAHAARLFADIAGGGASSRLFQQLREEKGLAYSVFASFHPWRDTA